MGYSARYHIASLMAVFFALAIGILIGSQYGGDLLSSTRKDLEKSLTRDLDSARADIKDLNREAEWSDRFGITVFPLLSHSRLTGQRIGLIGFGELPSEVTDAVEQAIEPTGGNLVAVGAVRNPPDLEAISTSLSGDGFARLGKRPQAVDRYGLIFGRQLITGGRVLELSRQATLSQSSGEFGRLDGLVAYHSEGADLSGEGADISKRLNLAILEGAAGTDSRVVGVETRDTEPSGIEFFRDRSVTTVDNVDMPSGKLSLIYALNGAEGAFGVNQDASRLMPELLGPVPPVGDRRDRKPGKQG